MYIEMEPIVKRRNRYLSIQHRRYERIEASFDFADIWDNYSDHCDDVLRGQVILKEVTDHRVAQILDEHGYVWRCLINSVSFWIRSEPMKN